MTYLNAITLASIFFSIFSQADEYFHLSEHQMSSIASEVEKQTENWISEDENIGAIWVTPYGEVNLLDPSFEILEWINDEHFVVQYTFGCGSERDLSDEFACICEVGMLKDSDDTWLPILESTDKCIADID